MNGQGESRLDRIEAMIERQVLANEAAHERFEAEDKRLLTAHILMNDAMTRMNDAITKTLATMDKLEMRMLESAEKLDEVVTLTVAR